MVLLSYSIKGNVKSNISPTELKAGPELAAFSPWAGLRASGVCVFPPERSMGRSIAGPTDGDWCGPTEYSQFLPFPLVGTCSSERAGAVQGAPIGAAERTLDGEDRSARMAPRGKGVQRQSISETQQAIRDAEWQP